MMTSAPMRPLYWAVVWYSIIWLVCSYLVSFAFYDPFGSFLSVARLLNWQLYIPILFAALMAVKDVRSGKATLEKFTRRWTVRSLQSGFGFLAIGLMLRFTEMLYGYQYPDILYWIDRTIESTGVSAAAMIATLTCAVLPLEYMVIRKRIQKDT